MSDVEGTEWRSIPDLFRYRCRHSGDAEAFRWLDGEQWVSLTWAETFDRVVALAVGLRAVGIEPGQRCAILSGTRVDWILADLAILTAGAATTTVYPSTTAEECAYILADSESVLVFAEDDTQIAKLRERRADLPAVTRVITFDGTPDEGDDPWVISLDDLVARSGEADGDPGDDLAGDGLVDAVAADDLATLIYTSGTTGRPKGVRLTHANWLYQADAVARLDGGILSADDLQFLWLPMSHSFGKVLLMVQLHTGFPTAVDGRVERLVELLPQVKPTFVAGAPRIFEKIYNRVVLQARSGGAVKQRIFRWAVGVGLQVSREWQQGREPSALLAARHRLADKLVFSKLRDRFGGRLRFFISGSAPLAREIAEFFHGAGILILEGYGLTETSAGASINAPSSYRFGSVGHPLPGTEMRLADDGELLIRSPGVMLGYHGLPEATAEMLDGDGWLHTGDVGEIADDGFVTITDRKKELIKTSGGKYVAPQNIENQVKAACPYTSNVVVHGDRRPFCTALVALDEVAIVEWADGAGHAGTAYAELVTLTEVHALVQTSFDEVNANLARHETVKAFRILPRDLSIEEGEITPSLKVRRRAVEDRYRDLLDAMYPDTVESL